MERNTTISGVSGMLFHFNINFKLWSSVLLLNQQCTYTISKILTRHKRMFASSMHFTFGAEVNMRDANNRLLQRGGYGRVTKSQERKSLTCKSTNNSSRQRKFWRVRDIEEKWWVNGDARRRKILAWEHQPPVGPRIWPLRIR